MKQTSAFFRAFLNDPLSVGSILPSSAATANAMIRGIEPHKNSIVLEIGCGTGAFTNAISGILPDENSYLGIEINPNLTRILRERFPALKFVNGDAGEAAEIHRKANLGKVGFIVSGLPFATLPAAASDRVLLAIDDFMRGGDCVFRTIQYGLAFYLPQAAAFRNKITARYGEPEISRLIWRNVPPVFALTWRA